MSSPVTCSSTRRAVEQYGNAAVRTHRIERRAVWLAEETARELPAERGAGAWDCRIELNLGGGRNALDTDQVLRDRDALDSPFTTVHRERLGVTYGAVARIDEVGEVVA